MAAGAPDFKPTNPHDDQCYRIFDVRNPSKPVEVGRWWLPGTREGDNAPPPARHQAPLLDRGFRAHNTNVYPQRPDRCYLGYHRRRHVRDGHFRQGEPEADLPLGQLAALYRLHPHRAAAVRAQSADRHRRIRPTDAATDWPKLVWILDARDETHPVPISTCPMPPVDAFKSRGGRFGAHNIHENMPSPYAWHSDDIVIGTFFNGGLRAYDISNPYQPKEVADLRAAGAGAGAGRHDPAQRRVRGRAQGRLHGRPLLRRPVHSGDGFLSAAPTCAVSFRGALLREPGIPAACGAVDAVANSRVRCFSERRRTGHAVACVSDSAMTRHG